MPHPLFALGALKGLAAHFGLGHTAAAGTGKVVLGKTVAAKTAAGQVTFGHGTTLASGAVVDPSILQHIGGSNLSNALMSGTVPSNGNAPQLANALLQSLNANSTNPSWLTQNASQVRDTLIKLGVTPQMASDAVSRAISRNIL